MRLDITKSHYWVCLASNGMPIECRKVTFKPTIIPIGGVGWIQVFQQGPEVEPEEIDLLEAEISGLMSALRIKLNKWETLK